MTFAAIQGLARRLDEEATCIKDPEGELDTKETHLDDQRDHIEALEAENEQFRDRVSAVEERLAALKTGESAGAPAD